MKQDLTSGSILKNLLRFSIPYLISCFLQTFYGLADLFVAGRFNGAETTTGISVGSQLTHMLTVIIAGLVMGSTVLIASNIGAKKNREVGKAIGNTITIFIIFAVAATAVLIAVINPVLKVLSTPEEAMSETYSYVLICFIGIPFITAYNVIAGIFRGMGDTKSPMIFVFIAGVINVVLDFLLIGPGRMGAAGAALATIISQAISVLISVIFLARRRSELGLEKSDLKIDRSVFKKLFGVGFPIACQDGFVQVGFLVLTAIANARGLESAAAVGIVEKVICFVFLVPSAMLSTVSAIGAQNRGAGEDGRSIRTLGTAIAICLGYALVIIALCEIFPSQILSIFTKDQSVIPLGVQYIRSYITDCFFSGVHFTLSGFFCAYNKAIYSFISNLASIICVRIPGAYFASKLFADTLFPMGMAAPAGSLLSSIISGVMFIYLIKKVLKPKIRADREHYSGSN